MIDVKATGAEIKKRMKERGITNTQLAFKCNVTEQAVYKWVSGRSLPGIESFLTVSKTLGCKMDDLVKEQK